MGGGRGEWAAPGQSLAVVLSQFSLGAADPTDHPGGEGHAANPANLNLYYQLYHNSSGEEGRTDGTRARRQTQANTQTRARAAAISRQIRRTQINRNVAGA